MIFHCPGETFVFEIKGSEDCLFGSSLRNCDFCSQKSFNESGFKKSGHYSEMSPAIFEFCFKNVTKD